MSFEKTVNIGLVDKIKKDFDKQTENTFFYKKYSSTLEELKKMNIGEEDIASINDILKTLSSSPSHLQVSKYMGDLESILNKHKGEKKNVVAETGTNLGGEKKRIKELGKISLDTGSKKFEVSQEELDSFYSELEKLRLCGEMSLEEFKTQLNSILSRLEFSKIPTELKTAIFNSMVSFKESQQIELKKVNDFIDGLYNPDKNLRAVFFKDENGKERVISFTTPEEARNFVKDLKTLAEEQFDIAWHDCVFAFLGDASEWFLPFTDFRALKNGNFEFLDFKDWFGFIFEMYTSYFIASVFLSGTWSSIKRRVSDFFGGINTKSETFNFRTEAVGALKTMTPLDINSDAGKDFLELRNRTEILGKLYEFAETIPDDVEKHRVLKDIKELDRKFFLRRSDTFDLKAYKIIRDLGFSYDLRVTLFDGSRIRLPILHRLPIIGKWKLFQFISKDGITIHKSQDFVNYIKSKDIENMDGLKYFYEIDKDKNFTLKQNKLDDLILIAEKKWLERGIKNDDITNYKSNLKEYIESLKGKTEHTVSLIRNVQLYVDYPEKMNEMKNLDLPGKIADKISELEKAIKELEQGFIIQHPIKKKKLNKQITELQIFQRYINSNNWFGNKDEFDRVVNDIISGKIDALPRKLDGFSLNSGFLNNIFQEAEKINVNKINYTKFINERLSDSNTRLEKINIYIDYYLPTDKEKEVREKFEELGKLNLDNLNEYKTELAEILGEKNINKLDELLKSIPNIEPSYLLSDSINIGKFKNFEGKNIKTSFEDVGNIQESIIQHYGLDVGKETGQISIDEFDRMNLEIEKIANSIRTGNNYTIGQLTYLIEQVYSGKSYEELINIFWKDLQVDLGKKGNEFRTKFYNERDRLEIERSIRDQQRQLRLAEIDGEINSIEQKISTLTTDKDDLKRMKTEFMGNKENLEVINSYNVSKKYGITTVLLLNKTKEQEIEEKIRGIDNNIESLNSEKNFLSNNKDSGRTLIELQQEYNRNLSNNGKNTSNNTLEEVSKSEKELTSRDASEKIAEQIRDLEKLENRALATLEASNLDKSEKKEILKDLRRSFRMSEKEIKDGKIPKIDDLTKLINDLLKDKGISDGLIKDSDIDEYISSRKALLSSLETKGFKIDNNKKIVSEKLNRNGLSAEESSIIRFLKYISKAS